MIESLKFLTSFNIKNLRLFKSKVCHQCIFSCGYLCKSYGPRCHRSCTEWLRENSCFSSSGIIALHRGGDAPTDHSGWRAFCSDSSSLPRVGYLDLWACEEHSREDIEGGWISSDFLFAWHRGHGHVHLAAIDKERRASSCWDAGEAQRHGEQAQNQHGPVSLRSPRWGWPHAGLGFWVGDSQHPWALPSKELPYSMLKV